VTLSQISYLLSLYPPISPSVDITQRVKFVGLSSGRNFVINSSLGVPGRYGLAFDDANGLVSFSPLVPASGGPEAVPAVDSAPYEDVESIAFFN
jgi:hypothetical protein